MYNLRQNVSCKYCLRSRRSEWVAVPNNDFIKLPTTGNRLLFGRCGSCLQGCLWRFNFCVNQIPDRLLSTNWVRTNADAKSWWGAYGFGTNFQIQCILYGKSQNPDCAVRIAVKRLLLYIMLIKMYNVNWCNKEIATKPDGNVVLKTPILNLANPYYRVVEQPVQSGFVFVTRPLVHAKCSACNTMIWTVFFRARRDDLRTPDLYSLIYEHARRSAF